MLVFFVFVYLFIYFFKVQPFGPHVEYVEYVVLYNVALKEYWHFTL